MPAPITDPVAVRFAREFRQLIAARIQVHIRVKTMLAQFAALGLAASFPADESPVADGSPANGLAAITSADLLALIAQMDSEMLAYEADDNAIAYRLLKASGQAGPSR